MKTWVRKYAETDGIKQLALYSDLLGVPAKKIVTTRDRKEIRKKIDSWFEDPNPFGFESLPPAVCAHASIIH